MKNLKLLTGAAVLAGLLFTTGCVKNEETDGVKALRQAQAGLLNAQATAATTAAEAQAALANAEAAYKQAQASVQEAQAEKEAALAEQQRISNALQQATNANEIAKMEAELATFLLTEDLNQAAKQAEIDLAMAEAAIQMEIAQEKLNLQLADLQHQAKLAAVQDADGLNDELNSQLNTAIGDLNGVLTQLKTKRGLLYNAQISLINLQYNLGDTKAQLAQDSLDLDDMKAELTEQEAALEVLETALADPSGIASLIETVEGEYQALQADSLAKRVAKENADAAYKSAINDLTTFRDDLEAIANYTDFDDVADGTNPDFSAFGDLQGLIDDIDADIEKLNDNIDLVTSGGTLEYVEDVDNDDLVYAINMDVSEATDGITVKEDELEGLNDELVVLQENLADKNTEISELTDELNDVLAPELQSKRIIFNTYNNDYLTKKNAYDAKYADYLAKQDAYEQAVAAYNVDNSTENLTAMNTAEQAMDDAYTLVDGTDGNEVPASENDYKIAMDNAEALKTSAETDYETAQTAYDNQADEIEELTNDMVNPFITSAAEIQADIDEKNEDIATKEAEITALNDLVVLLNTTITEWTAQRDEIVAQQGNLQPQADALLVAFNNARDAKVAATAAYESAKAATEVKKSLLDTLKGESEGDGVLGTLESEIETLETEIETLEDEIETLEGKIEATVNSGSETGINAINAQEERIAEKQDEIAGIESDIVALETQRDHYQSIVDDLYAQFSAE
ncbi:hypothetical protein [Marinilabilia sp.]|uniref:hypothetical protein n=1 Tax=Marinilabilia sp. TaxID=2021252 RepID=UPI0025C65D99|nr:hypothetical protein [Marinilabilia sp.]